jgi:hypothetical protein
MRVCGLDSNRHGDGILELHESGDFLGLLDIFTLPRKLGTEITL